VETNPIRMCELLVGLPEVNVLGVEEPLSVPVRVHDRRVGRPRCARCDVEARVKDRPEVELVDLPAFGRSARLVWRKHRFRCRGPHHCDIDSDVVEPDDSVPTVPDRCLTPPARDRVRHRTR
jgi:transposase